jgi:TolA-binding protein
MEDSPPSALWELAERFGRAGNAEARRDTLRFLVERYPSSRYARRAERALGEDDGSAGGDPAQGSE